MSVQLIFEFFVSLIGTSPVLRNGGDVVPSLRIQPSLQHHVDGHPPVSNGASTYIYLSPVHHTECPRKWECSTNFVTSAWYKQYIIGWSKLVFSVLYIYSIYIFFFFLFTVGSWICLGCWNYSNLAQNQIWNYDLWCIGDEKYAWKQCLFAEGGKNRGGREVTAVFKALDIGWPQVITCLYVLQKKIVI